MRAAEATLQLSQVFELGGQTRRRVAAAREITTRKCINVPPLGCCRRPNAFIAVAGAQRRLQVYERQLGRSNRTNASRRVMPASSPADVARGQVIGLACMTVIAPHGAAARRSWLSSLVRPHPTSRPSPGATAPRPGAFTAIVQAIEANPSSCASAIRAQRDADCYRHG